MREFRYTSEASHLGGVAAARTAGERWRAMSEEEKDVSLSVMQNIISNHQRPTGLQAGMACRQS